MKQHYPAYTEPCKRLVGAMLFFLALLFVTPAHAAALHERQQELEPLFDAPCARYQVPKVLALAIARGVTVGELAALVRPHPTFEEVIGEAARACLGKL